MNLGIFGGSFDPVHNAHIALAHVALNALALDELLFVPTGQAWQKRRALTPMADREAMLRLAIGHEPRFTLSRIELERDGPSYMIDTVRALQAERPRAQCFLVIGQDQAAGFHTWRGWQQLLPLVRLAVAQRPGAAMALAPEVERAQPLRLALPPMPISSTEVRARVAEGLSIDDLVPDVVARYIDRHHLYRSDARADPQAEPQDKEIPTGN